MAIEVKVPDIGDFKDVPVITVFVKPGDDDREGRPAGRARVRQGDDGGSIARRRQGRIGLGQGRRQGRRGVRDPDAGSRGCGGRAGFARRGPGAEGRGRGRGRARRGRGARLRPRRLHRRLPGGRPRQEGGADREGPVARRRLPQRRLHPVEGAAARRQGHLRGRGDGPLRREVRQAEGRRRRPARLEGERGQEAHRRPLRPRQGAQGHGRRGRRHASPGRTRSRSRARTE